MANLTETRFAYGEALLELGRDRADVVVLDADLYRSTRTVLFRDAFPDRFFDMGIAESDMVSTAAGMAASGLVPYCNSFAIFITSVCYMPVRTQIAYPSLPVKLVGSSAGLTQGPDGASHQSLEDVALMRSLPHMTVISPADDVETRLATLAMADWPGPVYLRLGRYPVPRLFDTSYRFQIGKCVSSSNLSPGARRIIIESEPTLSISDTMRRKAKRYRRQGDDQGGGSREDPAGVLSGGVEHPRDCPHTASRPARDPARHR
jgi:transketolase C-terminal domain/subunit